MVFNIKKVIFNFPPLQYLHCLYLARKFHLRLDCIKNMKANHILREVFLKGVYISHFPFGHNAVVVDIGAHFGYFSLFAGQNLGSESSIFAYEPSTFNYDVLKNNILQSSRAKVVLHQKAVTSIRGTTSLSLFNHQNNSIYQDYLNNQVRHEEMVKTVSLADIFEENNIQNIDYLKMDCEGAEYEIILKSNEELFQKIQVINMELHDMRAQGYSPAELYIKLIKTGFQCDTSLEDIEHFKIGFNKVVCFYR